MRTETVTKEIYKFSELTEEQQQLAIEKLWDININHDWWDYIYDDAAQIGLKITGFDLDREAHVDAEFTLCPLEVAQNIINEHGPDCETHKTSQVFLDEHAPIYADYFNENSEHYESAESEEKLMHLEAEFLKALQEDYRIILQHEYEYLTSEEAITETIEANDYEFYSDGEMY